MSGGMVRGRERGRIRNGLMWGEEEGGGELSVGCCNFERGGGEMGEV